MRIGYLLNTYPQPSVTFVRREIAALERRGLFVHRFAMRSDRNGLVDPDDLAEYDRTELVLNAGGIALAKSMLALALKRPAAMWSAFRIAMRCGARSEQGRLRHLIYLAEAAHVARRAQTLSLDHIHAHFGTNSTTVAMLQHLLGGPGYSFTTHGPEEFDAPRALSLRDKIHHARFAVAISSHGRSQLSRWADFGDWPKIEIVHCGIDPARFADPTPMPDAGTGGDLRLINIGRFAEQKGQVLLIDALARARTAGAAVHLTLVGDGELRGEIEAAIRTHGLADAVTLTGWLDEAGVRRELAASHALVLPSFAEGLPMVVMEAFAAARPVIATFIAGNPELVIAGQNGWLVPAGDPKGLADAMTDFAQTPLQMLVKMGQAGRDRVLQRHNIDTEAGKLAGLFQRYNNR